MPQQLLPVLRALLAVCTLCKVPFHLMYVPVLLLRLNSQCASDGGVSSVTPLAGHCTAACHVRNYIAAGPKGLAAAGDSAPTAEKRSHCHGVDASPDGDKGQPAPLGVSESESKTSAVQYCCKLCQNGNSGLRR